MMQYFGGKADVGKRIAQVCMKRLTPGSTFIDMFCEANGWHPEWEVNRIEFEYVNPDEVFGGTRRRR